MTLLLVSCQSDPSGEDSASDASPATAQRDSSLPSVLDADAPTTDGGGGGDLVEWPDATNTGVPDTAILTSAGSMIITEEGKLLSNLDVQGEVTVRANNVTIQRSRFRNSTAVIVLDDGYTGLRVEDVTIEGVGVTNQTGAIRLSGTFTLRRLDVSGYAEAVSIFGGGGLIVDNYFHDTSNASGEGSDTIEAWNAHHLVIRHNVVEMPVDGISAIKLPLDVPVPGGDDVIIEHNLVAGGGWTVYGGYDPGNENPSYTNVKIIDNRFSTRFHEKSGYYGPAAFVESLLATGNVWHESGEAINL